MAKYDRTKKYTWENGDQITISGRDFGFLLNTIRAILSTEQAAQILLADRANDIIEDIMAEYVEKGVIKEVEETPVMKVEKNENKS
jgi:hypothetical protein